ncbi:RdgB/HAM1 family non-canonical purine NTP pyrophosphatase [Pseudomonadota bacterium]
MKTRIVMATGNAGKIRELSAVLSSAEVELIAQTDLNVPDVEEAGQTFVENAIIKARNAAKVTGLPAIADDSGIEVDFLNGEPGIHSARYGGIDATDIDNNLKLLAKLKGIPEAQRSARFQCLLVYIHHAADPTPLICQGTWEGIVLDAPHGDNGFGYDPLFYVPTHKCSAAELAPVVKNQISHRGIALHIFKDQFVV